MKNTNEILIGIIQSLALLFSFINKLGFPEALAISTAYFSIYRLLLALGEDEDE